VRRVAGVVAGFKARRRWTATTAPTKRSAVTVDVPEDTAYGALEQETPKAAGVVGAAVDDALDGVRDGVHHGVHGRSSGRHLLP
jgi:hypothetical protein